MFEFHLGIIPSLSVRGNVKVFVLFHEAVWFFRKPAFDLNITKVDLTDFIVRGVTWWLLSWQKPS